VAIVDELKKNCHDGGILVAFHTIILCAVTWPNFLTHPRVDNTRSNAETPK
jgi:hypothetical protein